MAFKCCFYRGIHAIVLSTHHRFDQFASFIAIVSHEDHLIMCKWSLAARGHFTLAVIMDPLGESQSNRLACVGSTASAQSETAPWLLDHSQSYVNSLVCFESLPFH
jgi:hypothetical protein